MFHSVYKNPSLKFPVRIKKQMLSSWLFTQYGFFSLFIYLEVSLTGVRWFGLYNIIFHCYHKESLFFFICMDCLLATGEAPVSLNLIVGFMTSWYCHKTCPFYVALAAFFCRPHCSSFFQLCPKLLVIDLQTYFVLCGVGPAPWLPCGTAAKPESRGALATSPFHTHTYTHTHMFLYTLESHAPHSHNK